MEGTLICTLGSQAQHTHHVEDLTRSIQQSTSNHTKYIHTKHIANCFTKQFTNTVKHATNKTNININRATTKNTMT